MSATTITKKRKSIDAAAPATKKAKVSKPAEKAAPLKSALKKPKEKVVLEEKTTKPVKPAKATKPKAAKKTTKPVEEDEATLGAADTEDAGPELTEDQTAALIAGFTSSEDEASDVEEDKDAIPIKKLPQAPRIKDIQRQINKASANTVNDPERTPGVVYIGRLPHGFYEPQLRAYLSQFGEVTHLRLARNKKTGKSQHYGFVEFASSAVATIVQKTMDKYLLFNHILQVRLVPMEQVKEDMWKGAGKRKPAPRNRLEGAKLKRGAVREDWEKKVEKENKKREEKAAKLKELGYEFDMPEAKGVGEVPKKTKAVEEAPAEDDAEGVKPIAGSEYAKTSEAPKEQDVPVVEEKAGKKRPAKEAKAKKVKKVKT